jgi:hypothetical protein
MAVESGKAGNPHPAEREDIARRQPERLEDMGLGIHGAGDKILAQTDPGVRVGQIAIQHQRTVALRNALHPAIGEDLDDA